MVTRFLFRLADGRELVGPVQGCSGFVGSLDRLLADRARAAAGEPLGVYEPRPGCVKVCPAYSAAGDGEPVVVPLSALVGLAPDDGTARPPTQLTLF